MEKCIVVVMGFLERFKLATIVEGLELERLLAIYRSIINFYNKYAVYD